MANGGIDPSMGVYVPSSLGKAMWSATRDGGRMWYGGGWLWCKGPGHVTRLQSSVVDFGSVTRFDVPNDAMSRLRVSDYVLLSPDGVAVYDRYGDCVRNDECAPTTVTYKWEQYMLPGSSEPCGYAYVDPTGVAHASLIASTVAGDRACGMSCERIEGAHRIARLLAQGEEWTVEAIVFDTRDLDRKEGGKRRWRH